MRARADARVCARILGCARVRVLLLVSGVRLSKQLGEGVCVCGCVRVVARVTCPSFGGVYILRKSLGTGELEQEFERECVRVLLLVVGV